MTGEYDALAAAIQGERAKYHFHDPQTPYRGISFLWNGSAFPYGKVDLTNSERAEFYVIPGHPDKLIHSGHIQMADQFVAADTREAREYLAREEVRRAYAVVADVIADPTFRETNET